MYKALLEAIWFQSWQESNDSIGRIQKTDKDNYQQDW
jgi:hypothetical protein